MADAGTARVFLTAVQFLTRVPVPGGNVPTTTDTLQRALKFFPLVGTLIGLFTACVVTGAAHVWPVWLAVIVALACEARLTGAFHEDAVADFFDAFGGGWDREGILRIMKDSRIGSFGAVALVLALSLRAGGMMALPEEQRFAAIIASAALGRWAILLLMALVPPVEHREGLAKDVGRQVGKGTVIAGAILTLPAFIYWAHLAPRNALAAIVVLLLVVAYFRRILLRRIGGVTGDCLGTVCYIVQVTTLLAAAAS